MYGGQSWVKNGTENLYQIVNHYLRIADFTQPLNLSDPTLLTYKDIPTSITIFQDGAFWASQTSNKLYIVGGLVSDEAWITRQGDFVNVVPSFYKGSSVFSYDIDADNWSSEQALQSSTSEPTSTPVYIGITEEQVHGNGNLLTFNETDFRWSNVTTDNKLTTTGTEGGQFVYLPGTESSSGGIGILIGGMHRDTGRMESLRKVLIYHSSTSTWYSQITTSTAPNSSFPSGRWYFCAIATSAPDNSSHNLYIYGGELQTAATYANADIWILSIPSFRCIKVDIKSLSSKAMGCTSLAGGRYLLTYGGVEAGFGKEGDTDNCHMQNYGLRLFDLENLVWTESYEGALQGNMSRVPKIVHQAIGGNEMGSATATAPSEGFETPSLATLFQKADTTGKQNLVPQEMYAGQTSCGRK
ncbi:hypothetical protein P280DRAFT_484220 [Massarina eburnea CBS 473.64]|uniref:Galactose oxidase n=1 Tax=Massarina eburnea CBS 473.64 TaxID=1395130 RepID=A0A6A6RKK0_9PLEO|nr:hypothetical protein P280DRAFT_484220 [Massarina eburnea CBS 473.64]